MPELGRPLSTRPRYASASADAAPASMPPDSAKVNKPGLRDRVIAIRWNVVGVARRRVDDGRGRWLSLDLQRASSDD